MSDSLVKPLFRVVANGSDPLGTKVFLTLIATPLRPEATATASGAFELGTWPGRMAEALRTGTTPFPKLALWYREIAKDEPPPIGEASGWKRVAIEPRYGGAYKDAKGWALIDGLWKSALARTTLPNGWARLALDIHDSVYGEKHGGKPDPKFTGSRILAKDGSITAEPPRSTDKLSVNAIVPVRQSDLTVEEETVRAARVLTKQYAGPFAVLDERGAEETEVVDPQARFDDVINATDSERAYAAKTYGDIADAIAGRQPEPGDPQVPKAPRPDIVPPYELVVAPPVINKPPSEAENAHNVRRATQDYGAWLQRRLAYTGKTQKAADGKEEVTKPAVPDLPKYDDAQEEAFQTIRGVFFALQGDPILSRLFCLALDFEADAKAFPVGHYHLAVGLEGGAAPGPQVATAAAKTGKGFWPLSVFAARNKHSPDKRLPPLVEQEDGFWKHTSQESSGPRFELSSLDVRRSVASKTLGRDRGEAHQTGGFTILDRSRSEQIARDMVLAEINRGKVKAAVPVLHAEELTIGRRLDVGVMSKDGKIAWRSLMRRYIDYRFGKDDAAVETVLRALVEDRLESKSKGILEETSFQVAARIMPRPKATDAEPQTYEAVAEEAIFLWDGTPVSVLTDRGGDETMSKPSGLPFTRTLDLPGADIAEKDFRPPPLRFGVPYAFRFRSTFLGGGSPEAETASAADTLIPALSAASTSPVARRFLRHDSIASPILLLPRHLVSKRNGAMGFESLNEAIVRSWNSESSNLGELYTAEIIKPAYVGGVDRTKLDATIRVFVAPEAPIDLVTRHGKLDNPQAADIRKGGLLDVAYTPRVNHGRPIDELDPKPVPTGFPVAVSTRLDSLDPDGVIYQRTVINDENQRGAPVFEPGGLNTTTRDQVGYLPDPAVETYCLRAKVRDSDIYLNDYVSVKLYDGTTYPHALPLVVKVTRQKSVRPAPPSSIAHLCVPAKRAWLDQEGNDTVSKGMKAVRVQMVEFRLYQGEDFALEVSCLPAPDELANRFSAPETMAMQLHRASQDPKSRAELVKMGGDDLGKACLEAKLKDYAGVGGGLAPDKDYRGIVASALLEAMQTKWPIEEIAAIATLRICHAVNKPSASAIAWLSTDETMRTIRPLEVSENAIPQAPLDSAADATELGLDGEIEVDLDLVESFQIVATAVATAGFQIDALDRGRSMISRRSGRWPTRSRGDGCEVYERPTDVVGFKVDANGAVTLPRESVALLTVANLPSTKAIGPDLLRFKAVPTQGKAQKALRVRPNTAEWEKSGSLVFTPTAGRRTKIALWPLFAAAIADAKLEQWIALPKNGVDRTNRVRLLQIQRPHKFADTLARKLTLDLVLVSRGAAAFETEPSYVGGKEQALFRRQPLKREEQAMKAASQIEVWMNSTKRPAAPDVRRPEPSFVFTRDLGKVENSETVTHTLERRARTRLYLGRGWFDSGEGERLGIVLWPPDYDKLDWTVLENNTVRVNGRNLDLKEFDDRDLGAGGAYATRWGGDPIREDDFAQKGYFIPGDAFADVEELQPNDGKKSTKDEKTSTGRAVSANPHAPIFVTSALMPIPKAASPRPADPAATAEVVDNPEFLPVSLIAYQPCFDLDREEWYVDVDLRANRASEPFVRFGLVRYQEHSISKTLTTSEPVTVQIQLLPRREVKVLVEALPVADSAKTLPAAGKRVTVTVSGRASRGIKEFAFNKLPMPDPVPKDWDPKTLFAGLRLPKIRASVFHESGEGNALVRVPVPLEGWKVSRPGDDLPLEMTKVTWDKDPGMTWTQSFDLPEAAQRGFGPGRMVVYLEEFDLRMPASYREEPVKIETMFNPSTFVESGPRFSARVPFLEIK
ncbi:hypothetical protein NKJ16_24845 [Mesorhizobium sp. M0179]|uniref:hypothetical protein n=1 Tax=unclassified Mesorhizobium TaxID=325217 RepID=UPI0003CE72F8|nr:MULTISPECIES: hypothetical protein [unclassified Mesorhizobium]ESY08733.1 hypothetical protein X753_07545 [Mesorhizobium sp. LNJC399B00]WJI69570.1 hypothetical protein NLY36_01835 [Mesorhizobium sp. C399B]